MHGLSLLYMLPSQFVLRSRVCDTWLLHTKQKVCALSLQTFWWVYVSLCCFLLHLALHLQLEILLEQTGLCNYFGFTRHLD